MSLITMPKDEKITKDFVEDFIDQKCFKKQKTSSENPTRSEDKRTCMEIYNVLRPPLKSYLETIVANTWLALNQVLEQYWFKTLDGNYVSKAYHTFAIQKWNRDIDAKHVIEVINEYDKEWYQYNVWMVNEKWEVINWQHRLVWLSIIEQRDALSNPFIFEIIPWAWIDLIQATNTISSDWQWLDFLSSWVNLGNKEYVELNKLYYETYNEWIAISELVWMLDGGYNREAKEKFKKRKFVMQRERKNKVLEFIEISISMFNLLENRKSKVPSTWFRVLNRVSQIPWFKFNRLAQVLKSSDIPSVNALKKRWSFPEEDVYEDLLTAYNHSLKSARIEHIHRKELTKKIPTYQFVS